MPCEHLNLSIVAFETIKFFVQFSDIKSFYFLVTTTSQKPISIHWVPTHLVDCVIMRWDRVYAFATWSGVPNFYQVVFRTCKNQGLERMPITWFYITTMFRKSEFFFDCSEVKHFCCRIISTGNKFYWTQTERQISDTSLKGLEKEFLT